MPWKPWRRSRGRGEEVKGRGDEGRGDEDSEELVPWPKRRLSRGDDRRGDEDSEAMKDGVGRPHELLRLL